VKLLLDTHTFLWWLADRPITKEARESIADPTTFVAVSAASIWEATIKASIGKLRVPGSLVEAVTDSGFAALPISLDHAAVAGALPPHHRDPFDRMLVAQAVAEGLTIVTRDPAFDDYEVAVLPC
jgi:PIN domain nuclease of toxin-antitoxin system